MGNMASCQISASLGRASRALLLLAAATAALAPQRSLPVRCASRSRSRVVVFAALLRVAACAPYLLPLSDVIPFSQYIANDFPIVLLPLAPFAPFVALLNVIPFGSFIVFLGLSSASRNPELPRFVRFSM